MIRLQLGTNLNNIFSINIYISFVDKIHWEKRKAISIVFAGERERERERVGVNPNHKVGQ